MTREVLKLHSSSGWESGSQVLRFYQGMPVLDTVRERLLDKRDFRTCTVKFLFLTQPSPFYVLDFREKTFLNFESVHPKV